MTREEKAILNLSDILGELHGSIEIDDDLRESVRLAIKALEQEPKSEWEHDHEILKAYSDGANDMLDKIRAEIQSLRNCSCSCSDGIIDDVEDIIDKYKAESED